MTDQSPVSALALLRLQIEWGADEALDERARDRMGAPTPALGARIDEPRHRAEPAAVGSPPMRGRVLQAEEAAAAADSIAALHTAMREYTGCPLRDTASHTLFAEGDPDTGLLVIGEVPDADEDRAGVVFAGSPGALFDRMFASIGLPRSRMLIAPLIPWRPPGDRKPSPIEIASCMPFLHRLMALSRPRHLVLLGARPARILLGNETPLARLRGRWLPAAIPGVPASLAALPMRHPATLLTTASMRREAWHDLLLLRNTLDAAARDQSPMQSR